MTQPDMAQTTQQPKSFRRRRLQHYIRQIKRLVTERVQTSLPNEKLGTVDALGKAVELLRATSVCTSDGAQLSLSPPHSWPDSPAENIAHISDDIWMGNIDFRRHMFSARITLPNGRITDFQKVTDRDICTENLQRGECFLDIIPDYCRQALLAAAYSFLSDKKKILTRLAGNAAYELFCEFKRSTQDNTVLVHLHALEMESAFGPSKALTAFTFTTRHSTSCTLMHLDSGAACYIGYMPGEVLNRSILKLIHPYDMAQIKQIHFELTIRKNEVVRQRRLRWIAYNGSIVHTDSEWFAYWNPWTKKVDTIVGLHTMNEVPVGNADVITSPCEPRIVTPLDNLSLKNIETEIALLLNKGSMTVSRNDSYKSAPVAHQKTTDAPEMSAGTNISTYIDNLVEALVLNNNNNSPVKFNGPITSTEALLSVSATDLSALATSVPLSYSQINCLENVHRLLKSQQRSSTEVSCNGSLSSKFSSQEEQKSPLPVPEHDDSNRVQEEKSPSMPLTRELLQQHTRKWEQEYRDTWRKRLSVKRSLQQDLVVPVSAKLFRDDNCKPLATQSAPAGLLSARPEWTVTSKEEYYRSLAPNPPPPPGRNFQITSVPLPPPLPVDEHRSAFVALPQATSLPYKFRDSSQPINLSLSEHITTTKPLPLSDEVTVIDHSNHVEVVGLPKMQIVQSAQTQYRSVIQSALTQHCKPEPTLHFPSQPVTTSPPSHTASGHIDWSEYSNGTLDTKETCAVRLMHLAQRAQHQQRLLSPVKEATDALMLLQDTTSF